MRIVLVAVTFVFALSNSANATWRYAKWGMSKQDLIKASNGRAVSKSSYGDGKCRSQDQVPFAVAESEKIGEFTLDAYFCSGDNARLSSVTLYSSRVPYHTLKRALISQYGSPRQDEVQIIVGKPVGTTIWNDDKTGNTIELVVFVDTIQIEYKAMQRGF